MMTQHDLPTASDWFNPQHPFNSVSVVIPAYKGAKFIKQTIESILAQTVRPAEVLVIDDESPDDSGAIAAAFGSPVHVAKTKNSGAAAARNLGASQAKSNWVAFCDQDDLWHASKLEKQLRLANEFPEVNCVLTDYTEITDGVVSSRSHLSYAPTDFWNKEDHKLGFIVREPMTGKLSTFQPTITSSPIVKREFFLSSGGFDTQVEWGAEDTCFHFRCLSAVPFGVVPEILMYYNRHSDAGSADPVKQLRKTIVVWEHIISTYPEAQQYRTDLLKGVLAMQKELRDSERYAKRQKLKRLLGIK